MQITFDDLICKIIQIYLDYLIVYSKYLKDHFDHLRQVFLHYRKFGMPLNPTKFVFGVIEGKLLGHIVLNSRISINPERVIVIQNLQAPNSKNKI